MDDLDFFADLAITGTVLGLDHTSELAAVEAVFGSDSTVDAPYGQLTDAGLIEFGWDRRPDGSWTALYFGAQSHRLVHGVGEQLTKRYGPFRAVLDLEDLLAAVRTRGFELEQICSVNPGMVEYWEPTSRMGVLAVADDTVAGLNAPDGAVVKMLGPTGDSSGWQSFREQERAFKDYARALLDWSDQERVEWLDKRSPSEEPLRTNWWAFLRGIVSRQTGSSPEQTMQWRRLGWLLDAQAAERGIDNAREAATILAASVVTATELGIGDELPSMDDAVRRWLAATPATLEEAAQLTGRPELDPAGIRLARRLRNQIHDIQPYLGKVESTALADELRAWVELKPVLLGR